MRKLLLVEDSAFQAEELSRSLEQYNQNSVATTLKVVTAATGSEGLYQTLKIQPDIIVLDFWLPDITGPNLCKLLKSKPQTRIIPVVLFSVETSLRNTIAAYDAGADYYLIKDDNNVKVLSDMVNQLLKKRGQLPMWNYFYC